MNASKSKALSRRPAQKKVTRTNETASSLSASLLHGALLSLLVLPLLALCFSLAAYFTEDPLRLIPVCGVLCAYLFALCGGALTARRHKKRFLLCGLLFSLLQSAILFLFSLAVGGSSYSIGTLLFLYAGLFPAGVLGAYLGAHKKSGTCRKASSRAKRK